MKQGDGGAASQPQRERVLRCLRASEDGLSAGELAGTLGLHPNTIRLHLRRLAADGLVRSQAEARSGPGRPRVLFHAADGHPDAGESYRFIAGLMAGALQATSDGLGAVERAGESWGRYLVERASPASRLTSEQAVDRVLQVLDRHGFQPSLEGGDIAMRRCPFDELVGEQAGVVCRAHLGILRGALKELGAPVEVRKLDVFPEPGVCFARLTHAQ